MSYKVGRTVYKDIEVEFDISDFSDEELMEELTERGKLPTMGDSNELIDKIYHARRQGKPYEDLLDQYLYMVTGMAI